LTDVCNNKWCEELRVPIPRSDGDYRPITIEPIFGKKIEIIIDQRLTFINKAFNRLDLYNGGFVKGSRTQDNVFVVLACIQKQLSRGKPLYIAFVDFRKAFNFINRTLLFYKLIKSGLHGRVINTLRNMYSKIKARLKIKKKLYQWIVDLCGTNQGGPLSPNMFRKMLHDLKQYLDVQHGIVMGDNEIIVHLLWADDLVLLCDTAKGLQHQLNGLGKFCSEYQMLVNHTKTKILIIR
jgi:hypothetical protein